MLRVWGEGAKGCRHSNLSLALIRFLNPSGWTFWLCFFAALLYPDASFIEFRSVVVVVVVVFVVLGCFCSVLLLARCDASHAFSPHFLTHSLIHFLTQRPVCGDRVHGDHRRRGGELLCPRHFDRRGQFESHRTDTRQGATPAIRLSVCLSVCARARMARVRMRCLGTGVTNSDVCDFAGNVWNRFAFLLALFLLSCVCVCVASFYGPPFPSPSLVFILFSFRLCRSGR